MKCFVRFSIVVLILAGVLDAGVNDTAAAGPAHLLKDIDTTLSWDMGSFPEQFHPVGNLTLFLASTPATGVEICRTDGTEAGTFMLKDIWPGWRSGSSFYSSDAGSLPFEPAVLGDEALFIANDGVHGWELWKSDGTQAGTRMVKEIRPGATGPFDARDSSLDPILVWTHAVAGGLVYFVADDGLHGFELWRTDGTEAGTLMLSDIRPGSQSPFGIPDRFMMTGFNAASAGGTLYFSADDGVHGNELWKSDGTPAGTILLKDIVPTPAGSAPNHMFDLDGTLLFWAASEAGFAVIWRSDGTVAGTVPLNNIGFTPTHAAKLNGAVLFTNSWSLYRTDVTFGGTRLLRTFPRQVSLLGEFDGRLALAADDGIHGLELWTSDGTPAGTALVKDINPGSASSWPQNTVPIGGKLCFLSDDGLHGRELWTTDGTESGTQMIAEFRPGSAGATASLQGAGDLCYASAYDGASGLQLWRTDGTAAGTRRLETPPLGGFELGAASDGTLLFSANDLSHGLELWKTDGTDSGTVLLKDVNPIVRTNPSNTQFIKAVSIPGVGERLFFRANDGVHGQKLWVTDGTAPGTRPVNIVFPGSGQSPQVDIPAPAAGAAFYFPASDGVRGIELWRSDGTDAGTFLVAEINPGPSGGILSPLVEFRGSFYFTGDDGVHGPEIWKSDGTPSGTMLAVETLPGSDSLYPEEYFVAGETLYFVAWDSILNDFALWASDGSQAGTVLITNPATGVPNYPSGSTAFGGKLLFTAFDFQYGWEPWVSDGTPAGTKMLRDINPNSAGSVHSPLLAAELGGSIYFRADDGIHGAELWKTDGTEAGTVLVKDVRPWMRLSSGFTALAALDGHLYFDAISTPTYIENELWRTDGTEHGTIPVVDFLGKNLYDLKAVTGGLLWTSDKIHGYELWSSDGTALGTRLAQDIAPGLLDSRPHGYMEVGNRVFFIADDGVAGYEPWVARTAILLNQPARAIQQLRDEVTALVLGRGLETSLLAQLDAAARAQSGDSPADVITALDVFSKHVETLTPRWIPQHTAAGLREFAAEIAGLLEGGQGESADTPSRVQE